MNDEERQAWDRFAATALHAMITDPRYERESRDCAYAADYADKLLAERRKRFLSAGRLRGFAVERVIDVLEQAGVGVAKRARLPNDQGDRLDLEGGAIVNVFDTGTIQIQGKKDDRVSAALAAIA